MKREPTAAEVMAEWIYGIREQEWAEAKKVCELANRAAARAQERCAESLDVLIGLRFRLDREDKERREQALERMVERELQSQQENNR